MSTARRSVRRLARASGSRLEHKLGGRQRSRVIIVLACVLALSGADAGTVGASATQLRQSLHIDNTDIGLLVAITSLIGAVASLPFGVLADRVRRTRVLGITVVVWGLAMIWSATVPTFGRLLLARAFLGLVTASAGPIVASLVGDYFASWERGRIYSWVLTGELLGAGFGFGVTGDIATLSWRAAFIILAIPTFFLARYVFALPEPIRGGSHPLTDEAATGPAHHHQRDESEAEIRERPSGETEVQRLARLRGVRPDPDLVAKGSAPSMGFLAATRYILGVRTNVVLIIASACGYFYLSGVETFGVELAKEQYRVGQAAANVLLLVVGVGAVAGVLVAGRLGDWLLGRRVLSARVTITALAATGAVALFIPALQARSVAGALPYLVVAGFMLQAQNPPIDAARLDIMPPHLWGRAEGVRTALRTGAQALAPLLFGSMSDYVFGGGRNGLRWTFLVMLIPLAFNAVYLFSARRSYPRDVATAAAVQAAVTARTRGPELEPEGIPEPEG